MKCRARSPFVMTGPVMRIDRLRRDGRPGARALRRMVRAAGHAHRARGERVGRGGAHCSEYGCRHLFTASATTNFVSAAAFSDDGEPTLGTSPAPWQRGQRDRYLASRRQHEGNAKSSRCERWGTTVGAAECAVSAATESTASATADSPASATARSASSAE